MDLSFYEKHEAWEPQRKVLRFQTLRAIVPKFGTLMVVVLLAGDLVVCIKYWSVGLHRHHALSLAPLFFQWLVFVRNRNRRHEIR